ncbi:MAG: ISAs1 family transposase [Prevotellaceae bacterium]|jgi:predicted transposase YbfD/YdcC|nr:ISAs1 family transposase [Prevotellaceae bacterium]
MTKLHSIFGKIYDPRVKGRSQHLLIDIIILSVVAVLCGAESWEAIALYGRTNLPFLRQFLKLPNGIPSHDTIQRVFSIINLRQFEKIFIEWADNLRDSEMSKTVIAIDGKTVRGSKDTFHCKSPIHLVHAWCVENDICLGQLKTAAKSNEITAIPELLDLLEIKGNIITIDAMGTQTAIAQKIIKNGGDYILSVKDNQKGLREEVETTCKRFKPVQDYTDIEKGHGRIETRRCEVFENGDIVDFDKRWEGLKSVIKITATREIGEKKTTEERFYISSLDTQQPFNQHIRNHWSVENKLHWTLDVVFREDLQRKRDKQSAENFAVIRKIVLNILKKDTETKASLVSKRLKAGWSQEYLMYLLKI